MLTDDCGLVVINSVAAILTTSEAEASAERATVGRQLELAWASWSGRPPTP